jgi:plasmid stabilization system protein ParE
MAGIGKIQWSLEASFNLDSIMVYLENRWSEKEIKHFTGRLKKLIPQIAESPELYKLSSRKEGLRECPDHQS